MRLRVVILSSSFLLLAACCCRHVPNGTRCWSQGGAFALTKESSAWQKLADSEAYRVAHPPTPELLLSACNSDFSMLVQGVHCQPRVESFCDQACKVAADWGECIRGKGHPDVAERCSAAAFPGFREVAPTCKGLKLGSGGLVK